MKKLAIVGSGPNTRDLAPWGDESFDIWVFNEAPTAPWCKRYDACFQMHTPDVYRGHNTKDPHHWEWLQQSHGKPIYMQDVDELVPDCVRFPLEDATAVTGLRYFASTFAYMAALAIMQDYERVDIYGVDLSFSEYQYQAECWRFWIGVLKGKLGAEHVVLHSALNLFEAPLYGYEGAFAFGEEFFTERAKVLAHQWDAAAKHTRNIKKAIEKAAEKLDYEKVQNLVLQFREASFATGELSGALAEAERYQTFGNRTADRGGFEYAAAKAQRDGEAKKQLIWHYGGQVEYVWNAWRQTNGSEKVRAQLFDLIGKMSGCAEEVGALLGMYRENISYIQKYDAMVQANGGFRKELVSV